MLPIIQKIQKKTSDPLHCLLIVKNSDAKLPILFAGIADFRVVHFRVRCYNNQKEKDNGCVLRLKYGTWTVSTYEPEAAAALCRAGLSPITAAVLCSRGYTAPQEALRFLAADCALSDPFCLVDMERAVRRVERAIRKREHICVFGDYDVDGITATCLLTEFLRAQGAQVTSYIPARLEEGYGLNELALRTLFSQGVKLIVTVDCGITANAEAQLCKELGIDLVITDHHECKDSLPEACAVVDPHRRDQPAGAPELAGVGVAFKLACAIGGNAGTLLDRYSDLLCLGTVADVMPLTGENRTMVALGLRAISNPRRVGLAALMAECAISGQAVTAGTIGYTLAPRINAAGRMGMVDIATELFLTRDAMRAVQLASELCRLNRKRQEIESEIYREAVAMLPAGGTPAAIVLASENWHQGVVGIVASRLSEEYSCPAFLICLDGGKGKASSRSYGGFNLFAALEQLSDLLDSYGGHELAAGFTIREENIPAFRREITRMAAEFSDSDACSAALVCDCEIPPELLTIQNVDMLDELEPCGSGCPRPTLLLRALRVAELAEVGGGKHLRLQLAGRKRSWNAIFFSTTAQRAAVGQGDVVDIAFTPQVNEFRGLRSVQLNLVDIRPDEAARLSHEHDRALYRRYLAGQLLTGSEAGDLLPARQEFVALWRYLSANCTDGCLSEELGCLSRKVSRFASIECSAGRTRICLDVFSEQGLITLEQRPKHILIRLNPVRRKVDLESSPILIRLRQQKENG